VARPAQKDTLAEAMAGHAARKAAVAKEEARYKREVEERQHEIAKVKRNPNPIVAPELAKDGEVEVSYVNGPKTYGDEHGNRYPLGDGKPFTSYLFGLETPFVVSGTKKNVRKGLREYMKYYTYPEDTELRNALQREIDNLSVLDGFIDGYSNSDETIINEHINNAYKNIGRKRPTR